MFPTWDSGWVYIENVRTGTVIDVQGGVNAKGTSVWPYSLNYTSAQIFRFSDFRIPDRYGSEARRILALSPRGGSYYVSVKTPRQVMVESDPNGPVRPGTFDRGIMLPPRDDVLVDPDRPTTSKRTLKNIVFSIEPEHEVDESSPFNVVNDLVTLSGDPKQIWKVLPVENEQGVFFIQSVDFTESMVVEPLDFSSGGTLVLSSFTGSDIQKWRILRTAPPEPTSLKLTSFEWTEEHIKLPWYKPWKWHHEQSVQGTLSWANSNPSALRRQILIVSTDTTRESVEVEPSKTSCDFKVSSSVSAKSKEHCLSIIAFNRWQYKNRGFSDELCRTPSSDDPTVVPPEEVGVGKLLVYNCHSDRKSLHLWVYDLTANTGVWQDHGTLGEQWQDSSCPSGPPKEISIGDDHLYRLVAIDCSDLPPNQTNGSCHRLTSTIQGKNNGTPMSFTVS